MTLDSLAYLAAGICFGCAGAIVYASLVCGAVYVAQALAQTLASGLAEYRYQPMPWPAAKRTEMAPCGVPDGDGKEVAG